MFKLQEKDKGYIISNDIFVFHTDDKTHMEKLVKLLGEQQDTIIELIEIITDLEDDKNQSQVMNKLRQLICDMLNEQEITINHLAQERDYWKNETMSLLFRFGELTTPRERLMNYHYEMG